MTEPLEPVGDYGYDLVHQEVAPPGPSAPRRRPDRLTPVPQGTRHDLGDDLAYDEAHDF